MAVKFELEGKTYTVKDYDELTLADWKRLTDVKIPDGKKADRKYNVDLIAAHTGIPKDKIRALSAASWEAIDKAIGETIELAMKDHEKHYAEGCTWKPEPLFTFDGRTYVVPHDLDYDMTTGQWFDLLDAQDIDHPAGAMHKCLSVCLLEQGTTYSGSAENEKRFWHLPMVDAFALSAFFFDSSERFKRAIKHCSNLFLKSVWHKAEQALKSSHSTTEASRD